MVMAIGLLWLAGGSYSDLKNVSGISKNSVYRSRDTFLDAGLACDALDIFSCPSLAATVNQLTRTRIITF